MATTVGKLRVILTANAGRFQKGISNARRSLAGFARFASRVAGIGGIGGGAGLGALVIGSFRTIDALDKTSKKLGIATDKLAGLQLAAELTGVPVRALEMGLQRMTRRFAEAAKGTGEAKEAIKSMGLDAKALANASPDVIFGKMSRAMANTSTEGEKLRRAFKVFDSEGVALKNTLALGEKGLLATQQLASQLGVAIKQDLVDGVVRAVDAFTKFKTAIKGIGFAIASRLAPHLERLFNALTGIVMRLLAGKQVLAFTAAKYVAWGVAITIALKALVKIVAISRTLIAAYRAIAASQAIVVAFSGPAGWAALAASAAAAGAAVWGVSKAFKSVTDDLKDATAEGAKFAEEYQKIISDINAQAGAGGLGTEKTPFKLPKNIKEAQEILKTLGREGMSRFDLLIVRLKELKVPDSFITAAKGLIDDITSREALAKLKEQAQTITDMVRLPIDQFRMKYQELLDLFRKGLIDRATFANAVALAKSQFGLTGSDLFDRTKQISSGEIRGRERREGFIGAGSIAGVQKINNVAKDQLVTLKEILWTLRNFGVPVVLGA